MSQLLSLQQIVVIQRFDDDLLGRLLVKRCMLRISMTMFVRRHWDDLLRLGGVVWRQMMGDDMQVLLKLGMVAGGRINDGLFGSVVLSFSGRGKFFCICAFSILLV